MNVNATNIDLSLLPPPQAVEVISFEAIFDDLLADFVARSPEYSAISEADPVYKLLQVCAYREMLLRQRENTKARALMLAFATGADLDHIGVSYYSGTRRLVVQPADPLANPPVPEVTETDDDYRRRLLLQPEGQSVAGPEAAYVYNAISADGGVSDASAYSPWPAGVVVSILGRNGQAPSTAVLHAVSDALSAALLLTSAATPIPAAAELTTASG